MHGFASILAYQRQVFINQHLRELDTCSTGKIDLELGLIFIALRLVGRVSGICELVSWMQLRKSHIYSSWKGYLLVRLNYSALFQLSFCAIYVE